MDALSGQPELDTTRRALRTTRVWCLSCTLGSACLGITAAALAVVVFFMWWALVSSPTACTGASAPPATAAPVTTETCAIGSYELAATGDCYVCPGQCTACAAGGSCTACIPGYGVSGGPPPALCVPCPAGTRGDAGVCTACPSGTYTAQVGSSACVPCPGECAPGACAPASGACTACRAGARLAIAAGRCVPCNGTTWSPGGTQTFCAPCGGNVGACACCNTTSGACSYCTPGHEPPDCAPCDGGASWSLGAAPCAPCPGTGCTACEPTSGDCTACDVDYTLVGGRCVLLI